MQQSEYVAHILLIDDDAALTTMLAAGLRHAGFRVAVAADGPSGLQMWQTEPPDLILLDWMLPDIDGITLCRQFRQQGATPIIMLTARDTVTDRVAGLDAGADDYLVKPFHLDELLARVRARLRGQGNQRTDLLVFSDLSLDLKLREAERHGRRISLTSTEFQLLQFLMRHPRQVLTKDALLEAVWGYDFGGDANIVEQYIRSLRQKIGQPSLIQTMRMMGYVLREAP
jgi:DNA-binding response OmpR family regulator